MAIAAVAAAVMLALAGVWYAVGVVFLVGDFLWWLADAIFNSIPDESDCTD